MEMSVIGTNAGKVWTYLNQKQSFTDILEIKFNLNFSNTELYLALGWLAREGKIIITEQENTLVVKLK